MQETTDTLRKYLGPLDVPLSMLTALMQPDIVGIVGGRVALALKLMQAHCSQCTWYRRLFILLSRYTYVSTLRLKGVVTSI